MANNNGELIVPFNQAVSELNGNGSPVLLGFINNLKDKNIDIISPLNENGAAFIDLTSKGGYELVVRQTAYRGGGSREWIQKNQWWNTQKNTANSAPINKSFVVRGTIDLPTMNTIGANLDKEGISLKNSDGGVNVDAVNNIKDQLSALIIQNQAFIPQQLNITAEYIDFIKNIKNETTPGAADGAKTIAIDLSKYQTPATAIQNLKIEQSIFDTIKLHNSLIDVNQIIDKQGVGSNFEDYKGIVSNKFSVPFSLFQKGISKDDTYKGFRASMTIADVPAYATSMMGQLVNKAMDMSKDVDDIANAKSIFNYEKTFDNSKLEGIYFHKQSVLTGIAFINFSIVPDPDFPSSKWNWSGEMIYGFMALRPNRVLKIIGGTDTPTDQLTYNTELDSLVSFLANDTNAIISTSGSQLSTSLLAKIKGYSGAKTIMDLAKARIITTNPKQAGTVTSETPFTATIDIPVIVGKNATPSSQKIITTYYKNA